MKEVIRKGRKDWKERQMRGRDVQGFLHLDPLWFKEQHGRENRLQQL